MLRDRTVTDYLIERRTRPETLFGFRVFRQQRAAMQSGDWTAGFIYVFTGFEIGGNFGVLAQTLLRFNKVGLGGGLVQMH